MKSQRYPMETGEIVINGQRMSWNMRRSKSESAFGIRGSRIFELELKKNGRVIGAYDMGWGFQISKEEEEGALCLSYIIDRYGRTKNKEK